jgi:hypothetical protein
VRAARRLPLWGAVVAAVVLAAGSGVWADHGGQRSNEAAIRGVVVSLSLTTPSGSGGGPSSSAGSSSSGDGGGVLSGTPVGTLTLLSPTSGNVVVTVLSTTRFEVTGSVLAANFVGAMVQVRTATQGSAVDALQVSASNEGGGEASEIRGTVTQIGNGSITIQTSPSTSVTATLDPNVVVTVNDGQPGSLNDVLVGSRVRATWQVQAGQIDITAIRVLGGGSGSGSSSGGENG